MTIICTTCNASNADGMRYCDQCASQLPAAPTPVAKPEPLNGSSYGITSPVSPVVPPNAAISSVPSAVNSIYGNSFQDSTPPSYPSDPFANNTVAIPPRAMPKPTPTVNLPTTANSFSGGATKNTLTVTRGATVGQSFHLNSNADNEIGRWDDEEGYYPHIDLDKQDLEGFVHRRHAVIRNKNGQWWVEDLGGKNGTKIRRGGQTLKVLNGAPQILQPKDELIIGRVFLLFE